MYHFALWHEPGHRVGDRHLWEAIEAYDAAADYGPLVWTNEVRADRFAWAKVYPARRLPRRRGAKPKREIDTLMRELEGRFPRAAYRPTPLPTEPHLMVPASHVRRGISWAWQKRSST